MNRPITYPFSRRTFIQALTMGGGGAALGLSGWAVARTALPRAGAAVTVSDPHSRDWNWLVGTWDVKHSRLKERLVGDTRWEEFPGKSALWLVMGGLGTVDDNILDLPDGSYRGLTIRAFDPASGKWAIWWLDGRKPTKLDPPVLGTFDRDVGTFIGRDTYKGRPITMRFRWREVHGARPWWEQAFSTDEGETWEVNWRNYFTRTSAAPSPLPTLHDKPQDFDFLVGNWNVQHRRRRHRLVGSDEWDSFDGTLVNWPVLGGKGNVGDNVMNFPTGTVRGVGFRSFDADSGQWNGWWIDSRSPSTIGPPEVGGFADGVGTFHGEDTLAGRPVRSRVVWSRITAKSVRWEQSASADGGATWESNWVSDLVRQG